ncbi:MAG: hypothetical protein ABIF82_07740 [Planctomycetota bacterium]
MRSVLRARTSRLLAVVFVVLLLGTAGLQDALASSVYWIDIGYDVGARKIQRANLDGTGVTDLVTTDQIQPQQLALDVPGGKMYWTHTTNSSDDNIRRANLDGTAQENDFFVVNPGPDPKYASPVGLALDPAGGKMYWADPEFNEICRTNFDGTGAKEQLYYTGPGISTDPVGIALDVAAGRVYWTDLKTQQISRGNMDGSGVPEVLVTVSSPPYLRSGFELDVAAGKMYWANDTRVRRANLDGSDIEDVVTGLTSAYTIALDLSAEKLYWADHDLGKIQRSNLDGTGIEDVVTGLVNPSSIALQIDVISEPAGLGALGLALLGLRKRRK